MATEYKLSYTANEINQKLADIDNIKNRLDAVETSTPSLQMMEAIVDNTAIIHNTFNTYTMAFEADLPSNARVKRIEIPDIVNETNEYISLDDMVFKDVENGFAAPYYIIYPKNQEGFYLTNIAAVVVFTYQVTNRYYDNVLANNFSGLTIKIYYEIEE